MKMKLLIKRTLFLMVILSFFTSSFPIIQAETTSEDNIIQEDSDGFWQINSFNLTELQNNNWNISDNCSIQNGKLQIKERIVEGDGIKYDFNGEDVYIYPFSSINFNQWLPPFFYQTNTPGPWAKYNNLKNQDSKTFDNEETNKPRKQIHYFQFKIKEDYDSISQININWIGKASKDHIINMYCWYPFTDQIPSYLGFWDQVDSGQSNSSFIWLNHNTSGIKFPVADNYIHVCIVAVPKMSEVTTLSTDYIKIIVQSSESGNYYDKGIIESEPITKTDNDSAWELFNWQQKDNNNKNVNYQILYENQTNNFIPVENEYLQGNSGGFTCDLTDTSYISLNTIPNNYTTLKIKAILSSSNNDQDSPCIYGWGITWKNNITIWKDNFNSSPPLRINLEESDNIVYTGNEVKINPITNIWPMFGKNPTNTRASDAKAPQAFNAKWIYIPESSDEQVGGTYKNPVLGSEYLYIPTSDGKKIYAFSPLEDDPSEYQDKKAEVTIPDSFIVNNTPAIGIRDTKGDIVIVATGNDASNPVDGKWENKVYAFNENLASGTSPWDKPFSYEEIDDDNQNICYASSPTISDDRIYLTSWSGSSWSGSIFSNQNNKLIVLDLDSGDLKWHEDLPAGSICSPAVSEDFVIVGCQKNNGPSIIAYDKSGKLQWESNVGPIGQASPIIYNDTVIAIAKTGLTTIKIVALDINSEGEELWHHNLSVISIKPLGANTPTVYDDQLFVTTVDGKIYKFKITKNSCTEEWVKPLTTLKSLTTSPAYADGNVYVGTKKGIHALDVSSGDYIWNPSKDPVVASSSPIIGDGFLYYTDNEGSLYCLGESNVETNINGHVVSNQIYLPTPNDQYIWGDFSADYTPVTGGQISFSVLYNNKDKIVEIGDSLDFLNSETNKPGSIQLRADFSSEDSDSIISLEYWMVTFIKNGTSRPYFNDFIKLSEIPLICKISVSDSIGLLNTSAKYELKYDNESENNIPYDANISVDFPNNSTDVETLEVNLSSLDFLTENTTTMEISSNISKLQIRFYISNVNGTTERSDWYSLLAPVDNEKPIFFNDTFSGQINVNNPFPVMTIKVQDDPSGENITGLNTSSAKYRIKYEDSSESKETSEWINASCSGSSQTTSKVVISADLSKIDFKEDIKDLSEIQFYIKDMSENENTSEWFSIENDSVPPTSTIYNDGSITTFMNSSSIEIIVNASDDQSGIKEVSLHYRKTDTTIWSQFGAKITKSPFKWNFIIGSNDGGEYELQSIAVDNAGNEEAFDSEGELIFVYDPNEPTKPTFSSLYEYNAENTIDDEIPIFSDVTFYDDYLLDSIYYRMNTDGTNMWRKINTEMINQDSYKPSWNLTQSQWGSMQEDIIYSIYFKITDVLGNIYETPNANNAMKIKKNFETDITDFSPDFSDFDNWKWNNEYIIDVDLNNSNYQSLTLYYSYSENNSNNHSWHQYGENLSNGSTSWNFKPKEGDGYYSFKIEMIDSQGTIHSSEIQTIQISQFPIIELVVIIILTSILIIVSAILFQKRKKNIV